MARGQSNLQTNGANLLFGSRKANTSGRDLWSKPSEAFISYLRENPVEALAELNSRKQDIQEGTPSHDLLFALIATKLTGSKAMNETFEVAAYELLDRWIKQDQLDPLVLDKLHVGLASGWLLDDEPAFTASQMKTRKELNEAFRSQESRASELSRIWADYIQAIFEDKDQQSLYGEQVTNAMLKTIYSFNSDQYQRDDENDFLASRARSLGIAFGFESHYAKNIKALAVLNVNNKGQRTHSTRPSTLHIMDDHKTLCGLDTRPPRWTGSYQKPTKTESTWEPAKRGVWLEASRAQRSDYKICQKCNKHAPSYPEPGEKKYWNALDPKQYTELVKETKQVFHAKLQEIGKERSILEPLSAHQDEYVQQDIMAQIKDAVFSSNKDYQDEVFAKKLAACSGKDQAEKITKLVRYHPLFEANKQKLEALEINLSEVEWKQILAAFDFDAKDPWSYKPTPHREIMWKKLEAYL